MQALFNDPKTNKILKGKYQVQIIGVTFEQGSDINAPFFFKARYMAWQGRINIAGI